MTNYNAPYFTKFDKQQQITHLLIISQSAKKICANFIAGSIWLTNVQYTTNRFGLSLLHIVEVTAFEQTITFAYYFMCAERAGNYLWVMRHIRHVVQDFEIKANTFVIDRELALMKALNEISPYANCVLCRWHINKDILFKHRRTFVSAKAFKTFADQWTILVAVSPIIDFDVQLAEMRGTFPAHVMRYLDETWLIHKEKFVAAYLASLWTCDNIAR